MTTEKRGSEKLQNLDVSLCSLTDEELSQVSGGALFIGPWNPGDSFPLGTLPPDIFKEFSSLKLLDEPVQQMNPERLLAGKAISNGI